MAGITQSAFKGCPHERMSLPLPRTEQHRKLCHGCQLVRNFRFLFSFGFLL